MHISQIFTIESRLFCSSCLAILSINGVVSLLMLEQPYSSNMEYPGGKNQYFRHLLFFAFHRGQKATEAARDICNMYGEGAIGESSAREWFARFKKGNTNMEYGSSERRP
ncbi:hypothetical protein RB195_005393 [Necator americanus]|uniref:Mos1 transposase HTH domain-containing protein n=1 Tax=Necator americanus TaxID=51031 RepID=A0ABR1BMK5_NECAM